MRDYKTQPIIFDGLPHCEHEWITKKELMHNGRGDAQKSGKFSEQENIPDFIIENGFCSLCGAWRGQLGLEPTPELFIKHLVDFFDDVKLKLKDEGNVFVNLGDSYWGGKGKSGSRDAEYQDNRHENGKSLNAFYQQIGGAGLTRPQDGKHQFIQPKSMCMIPQRFAWGMIEHDWILRNEIIWAKPNHMPESVTDRLTKSHEVIYHFVKQGKYYYNLDAIRGPHKTQEDRLMGIIRSREWGYDGKYEGNKLHETFGSPRARTQRTKFDDKGNKNASGLTDRRDFYRNNGLPEGHPLGKNPGDVWNITTQPYPESHFAVFPLELVRRPIIAGCPQNGTVLDPFAGSGTVGEFCRHNDRNAILFELNPEYKKLIEDRAMLNMPELGSFISKEAP